jgi:hypothetical protein
MIVPSAASGLLCTDPLSLEDRDNKGQNETLNSEIARRFLQLGAKPLSG